MRKHLSSMASALCAAVAIGAAAIYLASRNGGQSGPASANSGNTPVTPASQPADGSTAPSAPRAGGGNAAPSKEQPASGQAVGNPATASLPASVTAAAIPPGAIPVNPKDIRGMRLTTSAPIGELNVARVTNGGQQQTLTPNDLGQFPKVYIEPKATVPVTFSFPEGEPNDPVAVHVEDGGSLDTGGAPGKVYNLDDNKSISFAFNANRDPGIYRVVVSKGSETRVLNFWAGPEMPLRQ